MKAEMVFLLGCVIAERKMWGGGGVYGDRESGTGVKTDKVSVE